MIFQSWFDIFFRFFCNIIISLFPFWLVYKKKEIYVYPIKKLIECLFTLVLIYKSSFFQSLFAYCKLIARCILSVLFLLKLISVFFALLCKVPCRTRPVLRFLQDAWQIWLHHSRCFFQPRDKVDYFQF